MAPHIQILALLCVTALSYAEPPANTYLPPDQGYSYPRPDNAFPSPSTPSYRPPQPTIPSYRPSPSPPRPSYGPPLPSPSARPPTPVYTPSPTYGTPSSFGTPPPYKPSPSYGPPSGAYPSPTPSYPAPSPSYGTPTSGYRPPAPTGPSYDTSGSGHDEHSHENHVPGMPFDFNYAVKDDYYGTDFAHNAISDGDVVRGEYRVQLPDGRLQIVKYTADWKNGFNADVSYQGEASYPDTQQAPAGGAAGYPASGGGYPAARPSPSYGPPTSGGY